MQLCHIFVVEKLSRLDVSVSVLVCVCIKEMHRITFAEVELMFSMTKRDQCVHWVNDKRCLWSKWIPSGIAPFKWHAADADHVLVYVFRLSSNKKKRLTEREKEQMRIKNCAKIVNFNQVFCGCIHWFYFLSLSPLLHTFSTTLNNYDVQLFCLQRNYSLNVFFFPSPQFHLAQPSRKIWPK